MDVKSEEVKISARSLVEFILRHGDIESGGGLPSIESMQLGAKIHRKLQRLGGPSYQAEVPLTHTTILIKEDRTLAVRVEGRADGIFTTIDENGELAWIDEIKGVYRELASFEEPEPLHLAQAKCYAYMYCLKWELAKIGVRITYCHMVTEDVRYFEQYYTFAELSAWYEDLLHEYGKWAFYQAEWKDLRDASLKQMEFPFDYRPGQKELAMDVYRTILREKKLFLQAPTGVGKTISTVYPALKSMGEGLTEKVFYLTAKTSTRLVAEETLRILEHAGNRIKSVTITAKEKMCILEKPECNPTTCPRAKGHYDRVNDAVYDLLTSEQFISREKILFYAEKHEVCPFEMGLDVSLFADVIIGDYNYVFDPVVYLRRFFQNEKRQDYVLLVDEAHNLVDRAREMFSAELYKEDFLAVKRSLNTYTNAHSKRLQRAIERCNKDLLALKRECDEFEEIASLGSLPLHLLEYMSECEDFLEEYAQFHGDDAFMQLYFDVRHFVEMYGLFDDHYTLYTDYTAEGHFHVKVQCMDPSRNLSRVYEKVRSAVLFSATLLPVNYYKEQLGGTEEDYAIYAPSPFDPENRLVLGAADVSSRYKERGPELYHRILRYIRALVQGKMGNYLVFFPSYQMLEETAALAEKEDYILLTQKSNMREEEKEAFLREFEREPEQTKVGFCVMGGIFGEGIDLTEDRLIGAVIVGPGLPKVCNEQELFRRYFDRMGKDGFDYAYRFPGMNKVLQSGGRVIRTMKDRGVILLLDDRFFQSRYEALFPREWLPIGRTNGERLAEALTQFWNRDGGEQ
ncbi:MAG: ATP-dependent DNA helicase [Lachnospiraceae bacterium]|nr:ATP-dependent DNA helicase [Lachnospiraceae bacterium]